MFKQLGNFTFLAMSLASTVMADTPVVDPNNLPRKSDAEHHQYGKNRCTGKHADTPKSRCQNVVINSVKDFCLWGPPKPNSAIGDVEDKVVAWCLRRGHGGRLIPEGTIRGAHFIKTQQFLQLTGTGDLTQINVQKGDDGGELDPHGATGAGNPVGGLVFTNAVGGKYQQIKEWNSFISADEFCFRACFDGPKATDFCPHIYDVMGCAWNNPGDYSNGFDNCDSTEGSPPGIYNGQRWYQGVKPTPKAQAPGTTSNCRHYDSLPYGKKAKHPLAGKKKRGAQKRDVPQPMQTMVARQAFEDME